MEIATVAIGRLKAGPERELCDRYFTRARNAGRGLGMRGFAVIEIAEGRGSRAAERMAAEAAAILAAVPKSGRAVCLHPDGELLDSQAFARMLSQHAGSGAGQVTFVIGGPDGLDRDVLEAAERNISFGRVTWPHQIVRILLAEQLYRAMTILSGHPYHRA